ncbi:MAG: HAMP domain-containing histidine kinase [Chloroflexota bacterium]|nr:HAMP domain-containing histidine kinase [Chloroflexota bacterium]
MGEAVNEPTTGSDPRLERDKLRDTLEKLLGIRATDMRGALNEASDLVSSAVGADKVDAFLHDLSIHSLVAVGSSDSPMARRQRDLGIDRQPIANGGRAIAVFETGEPYITGRADEDPEVPLGYTQGMGIRSIIAVPMEVGAERRGVLEADSSQPDAFSPDDLSFLGAVARWVGMVARQAELVEQVAQDAAEAARRMAAEELVTVLAHDFRNYLMPLRARIDMIRRLAAREDNPRYLQHAEEAKRAVARLEGLTDDLLDVARLEQGVFSLALQPVDLTVLAHDTAEMLQSGKADVRVRAPEELVVDADPERLRQALQNLLSNALKHAPDGVPVTLDVGEEARDSGQWAVLHVRDEGPGISPDILPRLFTRFGAGADSTGLGLGLYLARGIANAHGGELTVQSSPGQGAAFRLALPVTQSERAEP